MCERERERESSTRGNAKSLVNLYASFVQAKDGVKLFLSSSRYPMYVRRERERENKFKNARYE